MEMYQMEMKNPSDKDHTRNEEDVDLKFTDMKNARPEDGDKRRIEENEVRSLQDENSFKGVDLNPSLHIKESKEERSDLNVISPSNEKKEGGTLSNEQTQSKTSPDVSLNFGVYKSVSGITKDYKQSQKRRKMVKKNLVKTKIT